MSIESLMMDYNIRTMDQIISVLSTDGSKSSAATPLPSIGHGPVERADTHAAQDCSAALTLSNGEQIEVDLFRLNAHWWIAKNSDHDRQCGQGQTREAAMADLLHICEDDMIRQRDAQWRRAVARTQLD